MSADMVVALENDSQKNIEQSENDILNKTAAPTHDQECLDKIGQISATEMVLPPLMRD